MRVTATSVNHFLFLIDILGFSKLCESKDPDTIYSVVNRLVEKGRLWEGRDLGFQILYFSDTILFYQKQNLPIRQAFNDIYVIASKIFTTLASENIPTRGAISYGPFVTKANSGNDTNLFYGKALVEAAKMEKYKKWLGVCVVKNAIQSLDNDHKKMLTNSGTVFKDKNCFLLDPFITIRGTLGKPRCEYANDNEYKDEIKAISFIKNESRNTNLGEEITPKYTNTLLFLKKIYTEELYPDIWKLISK